MISSLVAIMLAFVPLCSAEGALDVGASLEAVMTAGSHASADIKGNGKTLSLQYSSKAPFTIYVLMLRNDGSFSAEETLKQTFEAGENRTAVIDLFRSPGWKPGVMNYRLHFLTDGTETPTFEQTVFDRIAFWEYPNIMLHQLLHTQAYTPSIYHRLNGRKTLGMSIVSVCGILLILLCFSLQIQHRPSSAIRLCITISLLFSLLTSFDLTKYLAHVREWEASGTYGTAGSLFTGAKIAKEEHATGVVLCTDDTSYAATLLSYYLYPIRIVSTAPSHVVVHKAVGSSYANGSLLCGGKTYLAELMTTFADGTSIYRAHLSP